MGWPGGPRVHGASEYGGSTSAVAADVVCRLEATPLRPNSASVLLVPSIGAESADAPRRGVTESNGIACWRRCSLQARRGSKQSRRTASSDCRFRVEGIVWIGHARLWITTKSIAPPHARLWNLQRVTLCVAYKIGQVRPVIGRPLLRRSSSSRPDACRAPRDGSRASAHGETVATPSRLALCHEPGSRGGLLLRQDAVVRVRDRRPAAVDVGGGLDGRSIRR